MSGRWTDDEIKKLLEIVAENKQTYTGVDYKLDWDKVADELNQTSAEKRSPQSCFFRYYRESRRHALRAVQTIKRFPRPMSAAQLDTQCFNAVNNSKDYFVSAMDSDGNVVCSFLVKTSAINISKMMALGIYQLTSSK